MEIQLTVSQILCCQDLTKYFAANKMSYSYFIKNITATVQLCTTAVAEI